MKWVAVIVTVLALAGGVGWKAWQKLTATKAQAKKAMPAVAVEIVPVRQATIRDVAQFTGTLAARSEFVVAPKVAGRLVKLLVDIGDTIENGQLIAVMDDAEYNQQVEQAKAELEVAKASVDEVRSQLEAAQRDFDRVEALRGKKIASESELDESRSQYRAALARLKVSQSQVAQREAALRAAEVRLGYTKIQASWTGGSDVRVVGERFANPGAMLASNDKIVSVVEIDQLTAILNVTERQYGKIRVGQEVQITFDAYRESFPGQVARVAPLVKETSRQARVEVTVSNRQRLLRPGMFTRARIELARHEKATVVPRAAMARRAEKQGVFLADLDKKTAKFVPLTAGVEETGLVQVLEPALAGYVVTLGQHLLEDGTAITVPQMQKAAAAATQPEAAPAAGDAA